MQQYYWLKGHYCRRQSQWTDEYVEHPKTLIRQNIVVVWIECLLVDVVRYAGMSAPDHLYAKTATL